MQIDWLHFSPWSALTGGALIGLASGGLILFVGRIAGISGILGELLKDMTAHRAASSWRMAFLLGLLAAPLVWLLFAPLPPSQLSASTPALITAGLLVGIGTRYANGCTSGHGICGLARLSIRSLFAVLTFMAGGFITVFLVRHIL